MNHIFNALLNVHSIKSSSFSLIRYCGNVIYRVEKIVCGQARRAEPSKLQFTEHLARIFNICEGTPVHIDTLKLS